MNGKNWAVIAAILILAAGVWSILGGVVLSYTAGAFSGGPDGESAGIWGGPIVQAEPVALSEFTPIATKPTISASGKKDLQAMKFGQIINEWKNIRTRLPVQDKVEALETMEYGKNKLSAEQKAQLNTVLQTIQPQMEAAFKDSWKNLDDQMVQVWQLISNNDPQTVRQFEALSKQMQEHLKRISPQRAAFDQQALTALTPYLTPEQIAAIQAMPAEVVHTISWTRLGGELVAMSEFTPIPPTPSITVSGETTIVQSRVTVDLHMELQDYKLRRYPVYTTDFTGKYTVRNDSSLAAQSYVVRFELPANLYGHDRQCELSRQQVRLNGQPLKEWTTEVRTPPLGPGETAEVEFGYRTTGLEQWTYALPDKRMVDDLTVTANINTADFTIPPFGAAPEERAAKPDAAGKYTLVWHKEKVSNGKNVVIVMPTAQQPGLVAAKIIFFGPVSLLFFFIVLGTVQKVRKLPLGGLNYIFLAAAFFAGHLLLAAFLGHVGLGVSFWIGAATSFFLVVMYMRLVLGRRSEVVWAGLGQAVYLIVVGYSFFVDGWAGLTMAVVAVGTLAVLMILTARSGAAAVEEGNP